MPNLVDAYKEFLSDTYAYIEQAKNVKQGMKGIEGIHYSVISVATSNILVFKHLELVNTNLVTINANLDKVNKNLEMLLYKK